MFSVKHVQKLVDDSHNQRYLCELSSLRDSKYIISLSVLGTI
jgi:hypothetical protein